MSSLVRSSPRDGIDHHDASAGQQHAEQRGDVGGPVAQQDADLSAGPHGVGDAPG